MPRHKYVPQPNKLYPLRVQPLPGESLLGFLHRFSERNGLPRTTWLTEDLKVQSGRFSDVQIAKLSTMCGVPESDLASRQTSWRCGARILGTKVQKRYVKHRLSRMCPYCTDEIPYHRQIWDLLPISHCPIHSVSLIDSCPTCRVPLTWHRPRLLKCKKDHDIRDCRAVPAADQDIEVDVTGICAVYERFGLEHGGSSVAGDVTEALQQLPTSDYIELLLWLSELERRARTTTEKRAETKSGALAVPLSIGFGLARGWPNEFHRLLKPCITITTSFIRTDLREWINYSLPRLPSAASAVAKSALAALAESHGRARVFGLSHPTDDELISTSQARRILQVPFGFLHRLATENKWHSSGSGSGWLVRAHVEDWHRERRDRVSMQAVQKRLGTKPDNIVAMIERGVFGTIAETRLSKMRDKPYLLEHELSQFLNAVEVAIDSDPTAKAVSWISFRQTTEAATPDLATTIKAVVDGRLRPVGRAGRRIGLLEFRVQDLLALAEEGRPGGDPVIDDEKRQRPVAEISSALGIDRKILNAAVSLGLLQCQYGKKGRQLIAISDAKTLLAEVTWPALLAKQYGTATASVSAHLRRSSITPIGGNSGRHSDPLGAHNLDDRKKANSVSLFRICDLATVNFAQMKPKSARWSRKPEPTGSTYSVHYPTSEGPSR